MSTPQSWADLENSAEYLEFTAHCRAHPNEAHITRPWSGTCTPARVRPTIAVVVTCHRPYLAYLPHQLDAIDRQTRPADERVVVLDSCAPPPWLRNRPGWTVLTHASQSPNPGRNLGIDATSTEWCVFADADDRMSPGYLAGVEAALATDDGRIGIVTADLHYSNGRTFHTPPTTDYWWLRRSNYVSSTSAWRRAALLEAGGWLSTGMYDDWSLALNVTRCGWQTTRNAVPIEINDHPQPHRTWGIRKRNDPEHMLHARTYGLVTLLAGRGQCLDAWRNWLATAQLPPKAALYILDNSGPCAEKFHARLDQALAAVAHRFDHVVRIAHGAPCDLNRDQWARHEHVPALYNRILPHVREDMVITLEDDVVPPPDALPKLLAEFDWHRIIGGMSAVYPTRDGRVTAGRGLDYWRDIPTFAEIPKDGLIDVGFIGGGLTVWNNGFIQNCLPFRWCWYGPRRIPSGWDSNLCRDIRAQGGRLVVHCGVRCAHNCKDT